MEDYERVLLVKQEAFVFKIPPRTTVKSYRAADWNLSEPQWSGRLRMVAKGVQCIIFLEDKVNGQQFAKCAVDAYPGVSVEPVSDSSRYFVLRIQDDSGRSAFIGLGFVDRSDSFDFNVALQDHFKWIKKSEEMVKEENEPKKELNLSFKDGETIKINMKITKKEGIENQAKVKPKSGGSCGILPPPPSCAKTTPSSPVPSHIPINQDEKEVAHSSSSTSSAPSASAATSNRNWVQF